MTALTTDDQKQGVPKEPGIHSRPPKAGPKIVPRPRLQEKGEWVKGGEFCFEISCEQQWGWRPSLHGDVARAGAQHAHADGARALGWEDQL
jgi:hypothetical protein